MASRRLRFNPMAEAELKDAAASFIRIERWCLAAFAALATVVACDGRRLGPGDDGAASAGSDGEGPLDTGPGTDAIVDAKILGPCSQGTDFLRCDANTFSLCTCTKHGPLLGTDPAGKPIYGSCESSSWVEQGTCSVACDTTINSGTACLALDKPVPECAQDGFTCWNGNLTVCSRGYPLPTTPCPAGTVCKLVPGCQALCLSSSATVDPRCPMLPGLHQDFCSDNTAYICSCGYLTGSEACGPPPHTCVAEPYYDGLNHASGRAAECRLQ